MKSARINLERARIAAGIVNRDTVRPCNITMCAARTHRTGSRRDGCRGPHAVRLVRSRSAITRKTRAGISNIVSSDSTSAPMSFAPADCEVTSRSSR